MSEYKWGDPDAWNTFCYVEKGSEKLGFFQTYLELKDLERQLEEAREEENRLKELGLEAFKLGFELGLNNETYELHRSLEEKEEELLNYKVKYNNQCSEMNRLKQSRKDQLAMIRKLKEKG